MFKALKRSRVLIALKITGNSHHRPVTTSNIEVDSSIAIMEASRQIGELQPNHPKLRLMRESNTFRIRMWKPLSQVNSQVRASKRLQHTRPLFRSTSLTNGGKTSGTQGHLAANRFGIVSGQHAKKDMKQQKLSY